MTVRREFAQNPCLPLEKTFRRKHSEFRTHLIHDTRGVSLGSTFPPSHLVLSSGLSQLRGYSKILFKSRWKARRCWVTEKKVCTILHHLIPWTCQDVAHCPAPHNTAKGWWDHDKEIGWDLTGWSKFPTYPWMVKGFIVGTATNQQQCISTQMCKSRVWQWRSGGAQQILKMFPLPVKDSFVIKEAEQQGKCSGECHLRISQHKLSFDFWVLHCNCTAIFFFFSACEAENTMQKTSNSFSLITQILGRAHFRVMLLSLSLHFFVPSVLLYYLFLSAISNDFLNSASGHKECKQV